MEQENLRACVWTGGGRLHSLDTATCQTMRWLRSALVGAACWLSVGSGRPSSSPLSSPDGDKKLSSGGPKP